MKPILPVLVVVLTITLTGCLEQVGANSALDQSSLCTFSNEENAKLCTEGQLAFFQPERFGNEQLPLIAAAAYCDFRHQVVQTLGGVVCVFTTQRL